MRRRGNTRRCSNKNTYFSKKVAIPIGIVLSILLFISIIFSLINIGNKKIVKGVKIGDISVEGLTQEEATKKILDWKENVLLKDIKVTYDEYENILEVNEFSPDIDIDKLVRKACLVGKTGNIIKDNYEILFSILFTKNIDLDLTVNMENIDKKINEINSKMPNGLKESDYYIEESNLIINKGKAGIKIKKIY